MRWINIERLFDDSPPNGNCSDHQNGLKKKLQPKLLGSEHREC